MTGKRFTLGNVLTKCSGVRNNGKLMTFNEVVDLLNEQHKKIQSYRIEYGQLLLDFEELKQANKQLKKELKVYRKVASCSNCKYHNYDWNIDDGYGGEEYEVCDKGNDVTDGICEEWEEL